MRELSLFFFSLKELRHSTKNKLEARKCESAKQRRKSDGRRWVDSSYCRCKFHQTQLSFVVRLDLRLEGDTLSSSNFFASSDRYYVLVLLLCLISCDFLLEVVFDRTLLLLSRRSKQRSLTGLSCATQSRSPILNATSLS